MPGYFSFQKCITSAFVKAIYFIGFLALTAGGIGFAAWAAMGLYTATMPRELGWYYVAIGVGILFVGNLVWRVFCEIWIVPFNIHMRLVSLDQKIGSQADSADAVSTSAISADVRTDVARKTEREVILPHRESDPQGRPGSVLGLS